MVHESGGPTKIRVWLVFLWVAAVVLVGVNPWPLVALAALTLVLGVLEGANEGVAARPVPATTRSRYPEPVDQRWNPVCFNDKGEAVSPRPLVNVRDVDFATYGKPSLPKPKTAPPSQGRSVRARDGRNP